MIGVEFWTTRESYAKYIMVMKRFNHILKAGIEEDFSNIIVYD